MQKIKVTISLFHMYNEPSVTRHTVRWKLRKKKHTCSPNKAAPQIITITLKYMTLNIL
jgi:hypothetical protein